MCWVVWSSEDEGASWASGVVGSGFSVWGGIVGGRPTVSVVEGTDDDIDAGMYQLDAGSWRPSSIPVSGDQAMVHSAIERPDGSALAVGAACLTSPDCSDGDGPAATFVWVSHDGGASWTEVERLDGLQDDPNSMMLTDGDVTVATIAGSDADGAVRTSLVRISPDGDSMPLAEWRWQDAESAVVEGVARSGDTVIAAIAVNEGDSYVPHLMFTDLATAQQDVLDLRLATGLCAAFGLVDIADKIFAVGVARTDDDVRPALVEITP